jgi:asparagine synthase (glutamine-hydrolysing)
MPGIYGVANSNNAKTNLERMANALYLYDHFIQDELFYDQYIGASRAHTGQVGETETPFRYSGNALWIEGEAYNVNEIAAELDLEATTLSALLLAAERNHQLDQCLNRLDGYFCAVLYNPENRKLKLISDRYGMRLLYWYHRKGVFAWGSEVKAILAVDDVDKKLDTTSYECFMDLGYLMGEHTWFEHIKLIKPATVLEYDLATDKVSQCHYWKWSEIKPSNMRFDDAVDELGNRFMEAVRRRFDPNERIGISLSGGLDSRAIFAAVNHLFPDYKGYAYTFGIPGCDDITIAGQVVSRSNNWQHHKFYFSADNWFESRKEKVWNTDGMLDMMHMHGSEFLPEIANHMSINMNGYCGDAILGGGFLSRIPWNQRITSSNAKSFYGRYVNLTDIDSDFYDINYVEPNLYMNRVRRFTAYGSVNSLPWLDQRKPFFDNELVELVFSIPDEYRTNNRLYSAMLQKFFPRFFLDIPWQKTGKPVAFTRKASIPVRAFRKGIRILKGLAGINSSKGYTDYPAWIRDIEIAEKLNKLLKYDSAAYKRVTDTDLAERWLQPHLGSKLKNHSNEILRAATIELYLRRVFQDLW